MAKRSDIKAVIDRFRHLLKHDPFGAEGPGAAVSASLLIVAVSVLVIAFAIGGGAQFARWGAEGQTNIAETPIEIVGESASGGAKIAASAQADLAPQTTRVKIAALQGASSPFLAQVSSSMALEEQAGNVDYVQDRLESGGLAPVMVQIADGQFLMGSTPAEIGHVKNEAPQYEVSVPRFSISMYEVTEVQFREFLKRTQSARQGPCDVYRAGAWSRVSEIEGNASWLSSGSEPAICITWQQAKAYTAWLSKETGQRYRLPSEAEWEYSARAGSTTAFSFGDDAEGGCKHMNGADQSAEQTYKQLIGVSCNDGFAELAPVGSLLPNDFGLYDMHGNVWEWTEDSWTDSHEPGVVPDETRIIKGGSWFSYPMWLRSANRNAWNPKLGRADVGFRVVREMSPDE